MRVLPTTWQRKPAGIDMERNYVTITLCISLSGEDRFVYMRSASFVRIKCLWFSRNACNFKFYTGRGSVHVEPTQHSYLFILRVFQLKLGHFIGTIFTTRDLIMLYMLWPCVRPSVCPLQAGIVSKGLNMGSHKQCHTIAQGGTPQFPGAKDHLKFERGHPSTGAPNARRTGKIGDFWQITYYISEMVQDRHTGSTKVEQEVVCTLSNGDINTNDLVGYSPIASFFKWYFSYLFAVVNKNSTNTVYSLGLR